MELTNFTKYKNSIYMPHLLRIIPAGENTKLSPRSGLVKEQLGKTPGMYHPDEGEKWWTGHHDFTKFRAKDAYLDTWEDQQAECGVIPMGMQTGWEVVVSDIDSDRLEFIVMARAAVEAVVGKAVVVRRRQGSDRIQLFYRVKPNMEPITKSYTKHKREGDPEKVFHLVEVLGRGQQTVIEGPNAKGKMHYWQNGQGLLGNEDNMPQITRAQCAEVLKLIEYGAEFCLVGYTKVKGGGLAHLVNDNRPAFKIDDPNSELLAQDLEMLKAAIAKIDITDERLSDYDTWLLLFRAMWAACGGI